MNHGGLGYLEIDRKHVHLGFPPELLEQTFYRRDGALYGIYYRPEHISTSSGVLVRHDLMLTPIPYRFWPRSARLNLRIRHQPGMIHQISEFLAANNASILQSESTRSAFRYETWSFYLVFEDLRERLTFDRRRSVYRETYSKLRELEKRLRIECGDALFSERTDIDLKEPVIGLHNTALAYFHDHTERQKKADPKMQWLNGHFVMRCRGSGALVSSDGRLEAILTARGEQENNELSPTVVFTGMDTRYLNMRTAIIPREMLYRFFQVTVEYDRSGAPDSSVGLISSITQRFLPEFNVWSSHNRTLSSTRHSEEGKLVFLVEYQGNEASDSRAVVKAAEVALVNLGNSAPREGMPRFKFHRIVVRPVTLEGVRRRAQEQRFERDAHDIFISYCTKDEKLVSDLVTRLRAHDLNCELAPRNIAPGEDWESRLHHMLRHCKEVVVLCTGESRKNRWVQLECGAAWALNKRIVPILHGVRTGSLAPPLSRFQAVDFHDQALDEYARGAKLRIDDWQLG